ncbi:MAG TPA: hypothetical protein VM285_10680 [Polyangia bacterium]|nr:hypothetical protein [Polyangia bacterium]
MTIPGFIIVNLLAGASVAFAARVQIRNLQRPVFANRYFSALALFEVMILLPAGSYFQAFYGDWSWMYLVDTRMLPVGLEVMAVCAYPVAATMGFLVGYFSARSNSDWVTAVFIGIMGLGLLALLAVASEKLVMVGSFDQYHRNVGLSPLTASSLLPSVLLAWSGIAVCWAYLLYRFGREGRLSLSARG